MMHGHTYIKSACMLQFEMKIVSKVYIFLS